MGHHPNLPEHRSAAEAMAAVPVFLELYRGAPGVDVADGVQAAAVIVDYGSGMFHGGGIGAAALGEDQALALLEDFAAGAGLKAGVPSAFPWQLIVPVVVEIVLRFLRKK